MVRRYCRCATMQLPCATRKCPDENPFCRIQGDHSNIPEMTPFLFGGVLDGCQSGSDPAWGSGFIAIVDWVYRYYGDTQTLKYYSAGAAYFRLFVTICQYNIF